MALELVLLFSVEVWWSDSYVFPSLQKEEQGTTAGAFAKIFQVSIGMLSVACLGSFWFSQVLLRWLNRLKNDNIRQKYDFFRNIIFKALEQLQKAFWNDFAEFASSWV